MAPPGRGAWTTIGLDEDGLDSFKNVIMTASLYADEMLAGNDQQKAAGHAMHDDIDAMCEVLGTDLDTLWDEFEQERKRQFVDYAVAVSQRSKQKGS